VQQVRVDFRSALNILAVGSSKAVLIFFIVFNHMIRFSTFNISGEALRKLTVFRPPVFVPKRVLTDI